MNGPAQINQKINILGLKVDNNESAEPPEDGLSDIERIQVNLRNVDSN